MHAKLRTTCHRSAWILSCLLLMPCVTRHAWAISLEAGDVILSVNGRAVNSVEAFQQAVGESPELLRLTAVNVRDGEVLPLQTTLRAPGAGLRLGVYATSHNSRGVKVRTVERGSPATQFVSDDRLEFARTVVQAILKDATQVGDGGFERCVFIWDTHREIEPGLPHCVWRFRQGKLQTGNYQTYLEAFGRNRSRWPPHTFCFMLQSLDDSQATVEILDFYNLGIAANSRGGNGSKWTFQKQDGRWVVVDKQSTVAWD